MARVLFVLLVTGLLATLVSCQSSIQASESSPERVLKGAESAAPTDEGVYRPDSPQIREAPKVLEEEAPGAEDALAWEEQPCEDPPEVDAFVPPSEEKGSDEVLLDLTADSDVGAIDSAGEEALLLEASTRINYRKFRTVRRIERGDTDPTAITIRYRVMVEEGLEEEARVLTEMADEVLNHPEGWRAAGYLFEQVEEGQDISIVLANPKTVDALCAPIPTGSVLSCAAYRRANLNVWRWRNAAHTWEGEGVEGYRSYLINHEVGHLLGMGHVKCPAPGKPAPVMLPQTKYLKRCLPNGHPRPAEVKKLKSRKKFTMKKLSLKAKQHSH